MQLCLTPSPSLYLTLFRGMVLSTDNCAQILTKLSSIDLNRQNCQDNSINMPVRAPVYQVRAKKQKPFNDGENNSSDIITLMHCEF